MKYFFSSSWYLFKRTLSGWQKDDVSVWCASLSYFTVFSLGPLLVLLISILSIIFDKTSLEQGVYREIQISLGTNSMHMVQQMVSYTKKTTDETYGVLFGTIALALGVLGIFGQLQQMLNTIWGVVAKPKSGIMNFIKDRVANITMVGVVAFLLLVSFIASTVVAAIATFFSQLLPFSVFVIEVINFLLSFILITLLFGFVLKVLPDVEIQWKNVWVGAAITALLFTIGKTLIGIYIGHSGITSEYGAAASFVVLLLWVYYSAQILAIGAEFTKAYTLFRGEKIVPSKYSVLKKRT